MTAEKCDKRKWQMKQIKSIQGKVREKKRKRDEYKH